MRATRVPRTTSGAWPAGERTPTPGATFLHIQGRDDSPTRVIELPIGPIRIGRGPLCEVRLGEPDIGDVQCMLRRRGNTWHFQPVGPPGRVWIEGSPADQHRPLPVGVTLRVGDHRLTLRSADDASGVLGSFSAPIPVEPEDQDPAPAPAPPEPEARAAAPSTGAERPRPSATPDDAEERLRRWQARLDQREKMLKDRQDERRWEARWKAAGEKIRDRSARTAPPFPPPSQGANPGPRPTPTRPIARTVEPGPAEPFRRVAEPARPPIPARVPLRRPSAAPTATAGMPIARIVPTAGRSIVALPGPAVDWSGARLNPIAAPAAPPPVPPPEAKTRADSVEPALIVEPAGTSPGPTSDHPEALAVVELMPQGASIEPIPIGDDAADDTDPDALDRPIGAEDLVISPGPSGSDPIAAADGDPAEVEDPGPRAVADLADPVTSGPSEPSTIMALCGPSAIPGPATDPSGVSDLPDGPPASGADGLVRAEDAPGAIGRDPSAGGWPSARAIFAAQGDRRAAPAAGPARGQRARPAEPAPTEARPPDHWTLPLWLGWFPTASIALALGVGGMALACEWTIDGSSADLAVRAALRPEGDRVRSMDPSAVPREGWWRSTATHLSAWALAMERAGDGEDHSLEVRSLAEAAHNASPLSAGIRFAIEPARAEPGAADLAHLGRPRDVVTLVWAGRRLRQAGRVDASLRAFRSALEMAARAARADLDPPAFDEDPQARRHALPRESLIAAVARDMARAGDWTPEQWDEALPATAAAPLAASRVLAKGPNRAEADRLADLAIRRADSPPGPGFDPAEHLAAGAEALALRGRWADAAARYRQAIDLAGDDATRRTWWLNLAEIAGHAGDDATRSRALEAARGPDPADEITRRAVKSQQAAPAIAAPGPRP